MISLPLNELAAILGAPSEGLTDDIVTAVATDNRQINGGELFAAIAGERVDGNRYAHAALLAGAAGVLTADVEAAVASGADRGRIISVDDPILALGRLAKHQAAQLRACGNPNLRVVGVTGSVGKTTTKDLLAHVLADRGDIIAPPGSFNNELGLPLTVLRANEETSTLVLEMGADHIGNLEYLTDIVPPDVSVVLAVARAHLGEFGGIENVAKAKAELVAGTQAGGVTVLNYDDERVRAMAVKARGEVVYFSVSGAERSGLWASDIRVDDDGHATFTMHEGESASAPVTLALVGKHHVANALAASAVARVMGIELETIAKVLATAKAGSPHRMDVSRTSDVVLIDDSYNANPDSMRAGIDALALLGREARKIAVLGTMLELGEESDQEHHAVGEYLADAGADILITVGDGAKALGEAAFDGGVQVYDSSDIARASELLNTLITAGDVVLLKGSHGSGVWQLADELKERFA